MTDERIVYAELMGQQHPMCLTVAADKLIAEKFGSVQQMWSCLRSDKPEEVVEAYVEFSAILMEGGRSRVATLAELQGETAPLPPVFDMRKNWGVLTKPEIVELRSAALRAFTAGLSRTVEVAPSKNPEATQ